MTKKIILPAIGVLVAILVLGGELYYINQVRDTRKTPPPPSVTDLIRVTSPAPLDLIASPLAIEGETRGTWFFEASFPVKLLDANGNEIAVGHAEALNDWMTENFVPFRAELKFAAPKTATGKLILEKDNPSGLPEYDNRFVVPVRFYDTEELPELE